LLRWIHNTALVPEATKLRRSPFILRGQLHHLSIDEVHDVNVLDALIRRAV
jgi:hypothetical protein